jgi:hypothetical protein
VSATKHVEQRLFLAGLVAQRHGCELIPVREAGVGEITLAVAATGSGILMATLDHLGAEYPHAGLVGIDLPGSLSASARAEVLDYVSHAAPTLFVLWASIRPPAELIAHLAERQLAHEAGRLHALWVYHQGLGCDDQSWTRAPLRAEIVRDLWDAVPLGSLDGGRSQPELS